MQAWRGNASSHNRIQADFPGNPPGNRLHAVSAFIAILASPRQISQNTRIAFTSANDSARRAHSCPMSPGHILIWLVPGTTWLCVWCRCYAAGLQGKRLGALKKLAGLTPFHMCSPVPRHARSAGVICALENMAWTGNKFRPAWWKFPIHPPKISDAVV